MKLSQQYAHALFALRQEMPEKSKAHLEGLVRTLQSKGHTKLSPNILFEYQAILEKKDRSARYGEVSTEGERTRALVELYRVLASTA